MVVVVVVVVVVVCGYASLDPPRRVHQERKF